MYGSTTTFHIAAKLAAALTGSALALPGNIASNDVDLQRLEAPAAVHRVAQSTAAERMGIEGVPAARAAMPADLPARAAGKPGDRASGHRCQAGPHCDPLAGKDQRELLVMLALWRALAP